MNPSIKLAGYFNELGQAIGRVNKLRAFDSVAGGLTGAAVGGLAGYVLHKLLSPNKEKSGLKAALIGAAAGTGLGVLAGNFAGDLGRRYISNNTIPRDYSRESIKTLKPTSFEQVWDTSINDKPNPAVFNDDYIEAHAKQTGSRNDRETALNTIMARRELFRRGLGVNSDKDTIFKVNQDGSLRFSSDRTPMQPKNIIPRVSRTEDLSNMDPAYRNAINLTQFAPLLGRFYSKDLPGNVQQISDSWDFDLHKSEVDLAKSLLKEKLKGNFASRPLTKDESQAMSRYDYGGGTNSVLKQLGARWILQNIIMDKPAVFKQNVLQSGHLLDEDPS